MRKMSCIIVVVVTVIQFTGFDKSITDIAERYAVMMHITSASSMNVVMLNIRQDAGNETKWQKHNILSRVGQATLKTAILLYLAYRKDEAH